MTNYTFDTRFRTHRRAIIDHGEVTAEEEVKILYPYVLRDSSEIKQYGRKYIDTWIATGKHPKITINDDEEYKYLFLTGFVTEYVKTVAKMDAETTISNAIIRVTHVEHKGDTNIYHIDLTDPSYLTKTWKFRIGLPSKEGSMSPPELE